MSPASGNATVRIAVSDLDVEIRAGTAADTQLLLTFIRSMAAFEKLDVSATAESLREALFGEHPVAHTVLVFADGSPIGYVIYFFSFTSMMGRRTLWLDDLFIEPGFRGKGIGSALMAYLANIAVKNRCARFEWIVLDWNARAIDFYRRLGATVLPDWRICRVQGQQLENIAKGPNGLPGMGSGA